MKNNSVNTSALPGADNISRTVLENGIVVLARSNFNSPSVAISGYLNAGALFETDDKLGLADYTASVLMRGNEQRDFMEIYNALESVGAGVGFSSGTHSTGFNGRALAEDLALVLEILSQTARQPVFPNEHIEKVRAQLLTGLAISSQDTGDMASELFDEIVFANHPYSRPEEGTPETIKSITRDDIASFHKKHFGPKGMVISIVGAIDAKQAVEHIQRAFGDWKNDEQPNPPELPKVEPLKTKVHKHKTIAGKTQSDIMMGAFGPHRKTPEYTAATLANSILGQFGMMGRIGDVVREQSGLAYYAYSGLSAGMGPGSWEIVAGVNAQNVDKAIELIQKEVAKFTKDGVTKEELEDSKANFIGRLPISLESNAGVAGALLNIERFDLGLDYYRNYPAMVNAVTADEAVSAARKYLDADKLAIATAGP